MVETYTVSMNFPVVLNISEPGNYSVAVFGWSDDMIEPFPAELQQVVITGMSQGNQYCIVGVFMRYILPVICFTAS